VPLGPAGPVLQKLGYVRRWVRLAEKIVAPSGVRTASGSAAEPSPAGRRRYHTERNHGAMILHVP